MTVILELPVSSYSQLTFRHFSLMCVFHGYLPHELKAFDSDFVCFAVLRLQKAGILGFTM